MAEGCGQHLKTAGARSSVASFWMVDIAIRVGAEAIVIRATPMHSNAAALACRVDR